ncbi:hypothetical protein J41TS12_33220 [Paenibacillus antibioticophila]|uniref:Uncharacterized protein n=1 Tax=Paenibacillus antibioticophila TaxID=1274374 RepID=A0A919XU29_9BACL|nr:hypothetical protein J41TS12_33220 [Paenibacillus antibioticophila]
MALNGIHPPSGFVRSIPSCLILTDRIGFPASNERVRRNHLNTGDGNSRNLSSLIWITGS